MSGVRVTRGKDGVWFCRPYLGTNALTGKPMRPYRRFPEASGEAEARELAQEWVNTLAPAAGLRVSMRVATCSRATSPRSRRTARARTP